MVVGPDFLPVQARVQAANRRGVGTGAFSAPVQQHPQPPVVVLRLLWRYPRIDDVGVFVARYDESLCGTVHVDIEVAGGSPAAS
jgi:hypothetical protein